MKEKRKELGIPEDAFLVLSVGEVNGNKNHETVIRAFAKAEIPNSFYLICGKGAKTEELKELCKKLGVEEQVKFLGFRSDAKQICKQYWMRLLLQLKQEMQDDLRIFCRNLFFS